MSEELGVTTESAQGGVQPHQDVTQDSTAAHTPGQLLCSTRKARGLSIEEVARTIKFTPRQIEALERDDYASLPGATVVRGFMRSYARFLQLDADSVLAGYESQMPKLAASMGVVSDIGASLPMPGKGGWVGTGHARLVLAGASLLLAALAYFFWPLTGADFPLRSETSQAVPAYPASDTHPNTSASHADANGVTPMGLVAHAGSEQGAAPVSQDSAVMAAATPAAAAAIAASATLAGATSEGGSASNTLPVAATATAGVTSPSAVAAATLAASAAPAAAKPGLPVELPQLVFVFADRAWLEVKDATGRVLLAQNNLPKTQQRVTGKPPFDIVIGNASHVKLLYEDQPVDLQPYTKVDVARLRLE